MEEKIERIAKNIVHCSYKVHKELGPGLLEKVYEICLVHELEKCGYNVKRQVEIPIVYDGMTFKEGLRLDIVVENEIIIEVKAVELVNAVWEAQIISQLKITNMKLGFLINFTVPLIKNGIRRFINSNNK
jgi:GxxExxY protein